MLASSSPKRLSGRDCPAGGEIDALEVGAGVERRIDEGVERDGLEVDDGAVALIELKRGGEVPVGVGELDGGPEGDVAGEVAAG